MIQETLSQVKKRIEEAQPLTREKKVELLDLITKLQIEIEQLARTNREHAESIAGFTQTSMHEATRREKNEQLHKLSVDGLAGTVEGFESIHPRLVEIVNSICTSLSNMGI
jgi:queuine/archaeosine tRNA-ribosyltransferase